MIYLLAVLCSFLYYLGGRGGYWYRDLLFRRVGCSLSIVYALGYSCGWDWSLGVVALLMYGALTISDFGEFFWTAQAIAVAGACLPYAYRKDFFCAECLVLGMIPVLVYVVSRFCQPRDPWLRGAIYGAIPIIFFWVR